MTIIALAASASPAAAHAGDDVPVVDEAELTIGAFDVEMSLGEEDDYLFPLDLELSSAAGANVESVEVHWIDDRGVARSAPAHRVDTGSSIRFEAAVGQTEDHRLDLTLVVASTAGEVASARFETDVESVPPWIDVIVLVTALWTLPFAAWMVQRFSRTWLRPIRWDRSQLDRYLVPPTPEFLT